MMEIPDDGDILGALERQQAASASPPDSAPDGQSGAQPSGGSGRGFGPSVVQSLATAGAGALWTGAGASLRSKHSILPAGMVSVTTPSRSAAGDRAAAAYPSLSARPRPVSVQVRWLAALPFARVLRRPYDGCSPARVLLRSPGGMHELHVDLVLRAGVSGVDVLALP